MPPLFFRRVIGAVSLAFLAFAGGLAAAEPPAIDPRAAEILTSALTHLAEAKHLALRAEMTDETTLPSGEKLQYPAALEISVRRPDRLRYSIEGEQRSVGGWYDGKTFTLLDRGKNVFAATPAPRGLSAVFDELMEKFGFRPPLAILLREDAVNMATNGLVSGFYVGRGVVGGDLCHHLAFRRENIDWQVWVAAEGPPLIKRIIVTRKRQPGAPQLSFSFLSWDLTTAQEDAHFAFEQPQGAVWCEFQQLGQPGPGREGRR